MSLKGYAALAGFCLVLAMLLCWPGLLRAQPQAETDLQSSDCVKCHAKVVKEVEDAGMAHKTSVGCRDCHNGHPPMSFEIIPACSSCHSRSATPHFQLLECLSCHNPHQPLAIRLPLYITDPCLTCHENQIKDLKAFPSYHSSLDCTSCHEGRHGYVPDCTSCHRPHGAMTTEADCRNCHRAHRPLTVSIPSSIPSSECAGCHAQAYLTLQESQSRHVDIACAACHTGEHKQIPACQDCHGTRHAPELLKQFPNCGDCHDSAHNLTR